MLRCVALALACASCRASLFASLVETRDDDAPADHREAAATPEAPPSKRDVLAWRSRLERKRACVSSGVGAFYLYHARKAAGTSLRAALQHAAKRSRVDYLETEGLSIDARFLGLRSVITVVSLRDPVRRVLSMYWYEHVGWHDGVTHDHSKLRTLRSWADEWVEGSAWKREFEKKHPGNVYIEVENYFTKMLTGWNRDGRGEALDGASLASAKAALDRFDFVFIVERGRRANHTRLLWDALGYELPLTSELRGDDAAKARLRPKLAADEADVVRFLEARNALDAALYAYALALDDDRVAASAAPAPRTRGERPPCEKPPLRQLKPKTGIFRPPGHKH